jgi:hypothetical protein
LSLNTTDDVSATTDVNATHNNEPEKSTSMLQKLVSARENAVPLYMNGNFKV